MKKSLKILFMFVAGATFGQSSDSYICDTSNQSVIIGFDQFAGTVTSKASGLAAVSTKTASVKFEKTQIILEDGSTQNYLARFNPYTNQVEVNLDGKTVYLRKTKGVEIKFIESKKTFESFSFLVSDGSIKSGLFAQEGNSNLYAKTDYTYVPAKKAKDSYSSDKPASFKEDLSYFYKNYNNHLVKLPTKKKDIAEAFPELSSKEIKSFLKNNKIKTNSVASLVKLTEYISTLESDKYPNSAVAVLTNK